MESKFVCPCGLTCCDCLFYKSEIYETAKRLKELIRDSQLDIFLGLLCKNEGWRAMAKHIGEDENEIGRYFQPFKKIPDFLDVLDAIIKIQCKQTCRESGGCSIGEATRECTAKKCIRSKGYDGCWDCAEVEHCDKLNFLKMAYGETIEENLKIMKEKGVDAAQSRGNKYYAWQRRSYPGGQRNRLL